MKPPLPRTLSAVPRTLHVQFEIAKAIRALTSRAAVREGSGRRSGTSRLAGWHTGRQGRPISAKGRRCKCF